MALRFFIDFDGTITKKDVVDSLLENFAAHDWKKIENEWAAGLIGSRECLNRQIRLVTLSETDFTRFLSSIEIDPAFPKFLETAARKNVPVAVVSDGFDAMIQSAFQSAFQNDGVYLKNVKVFSNQLRWTPESLEPEFPAPPCEHGCANCKVRVLKSERAPGDYAVFIGDGLSDRFAAREADFVFAKGKLLDFCEKERIAYQAYLNFGEIENWLKNF